MSLLWRDLVKNPSRAYLLAPWRTTGPSPKRTAAPGSSQSRLRALRSTVGGHSSITLKTPGSFASTKFDRDGIADVLE